MFLPDFVIVCENFSAAEQNESGRELFAVLSSNGKGSGSLFRGGRLEDGSESLFRGDATKLASGACFGVCEG
jgi:hypothetical protein